MIAFFNTIVEVDDVDVKKIHSTKETYAAFVHLFAKCIVPSTIFKDVTHRSQGKFHDTFTPADEALCLIILDNNVSKWKTEAQKKVEKNQGIIPQHLKDIILDKNEMKSIPKSKYTMGTGSESNNLRSGWNHDGMTNYTELKEQVVKFRSENLFNPFKEYALAGIVDISCQHRSKRKRTSAEDFDSCSTNNTALCEELSEKLLNDSKFAAL